MAVLDEVDGVQSARRTCSENDPGSEQWSEASFVGRLTEEAVFDRGLYEALERAIGCVANGSPTAEDVWSLLRILERVTLLIGSHLDPADAYRIANLREDEVLDFSNDFRFLLRELSLQRRPR